MSRRETVRDTVLIAESRSREAANARESCLIWSALTALAVLGLLGYECYQSYIGGKPGEATIEILKGLGALVAICVALCVCIYVWSLVAEPFKSAVLWIGIDVENEKVKSIIAGIFLLLIFSLWIYVKFFVELPPELQK